MSSSKLRTSLALLPSPITALVVGGTSGIGAGIAIALSQHAHTDSAVYIAGRREHAAKEVIAAAAKASGHEGRMKFRPLDASLMQNIERFCIDMKEELNGRQIDVLGLCQGILSFTKKDTTEGIIDVVAINYYGRMYCIKKLISLGVLSPTCIVIDVLNAKAGDASGKTIALDDMDMRHTGIRASVLQNMAMHDVLIQDLGVSQDQNGPRRTFIHDYPGFVKTDLVKNVVLKTLFSITELFLRRSIGIEEAGKRIVSGSIACAERTKGGEKAYWYIDEHGAEIEKDVTAAEVREKVRDHTWSIVDMALNGGVQHV